VEGFNSGVKGLNVTVELISAKTIGTAHVIGLKGFYDEV
jgi:hypothetical protein